MVDDLLHLNQRRAAYEAVLKRYGDVLPNAAELSDMVHRELAKEALWVAARAYDRRQTDTVPVEKLDRVRVRLLARRGQPEHLPRPAVASPYRACRHAVPPAARVAAAPGAPGARSRAPGEGQAVVARMRARI